MREDTARIHTTVQRSQCQAAGPLEAPKLWGRLSRKVKVEGGRLASRKVTRKGCCMQEGGRMVQLNGGASGKGLMREVQVDRRSTQWDSHYWSEEGGHRARGCRRAITG